MSWHHHMQRSITSNAPGRGRVATGCSGHLKTYMAQGGRCFHCGKPMHTSPYYQGDNRNGWTREHVIPKAMSGFGLGCIVLAHSKCNAKRGCRPPSRDDLDKAIRIIKRAHGVIPNPLLNFRTSAMVAA